MNFRLVPKSVTLNGLERRNGPYFALFFLPNLVISGAYCVKVVDKAITIDENEKQIKTQQIIQTKQKHVKTETKLKNICHLV